MRYRRRALKMLRLFVRSGTIGCLAKQLGPFGGLDTLGILLDRRYVYCTQSNAFVKRWAVTKRGRLAYATDPRSVV